MENFKNIIIHIPHASLRLPEIFKDKLLQTQEKIDYQNIFMSDYLVDQFVPNNFSNIIKFEFSRLFCDVERFRDDKEEEMIKYGMGAIYEKDSDNQKIIDVDLNYKNEVLLNYYDKHHNKIDELTTNILEKHEKCYIMDLHSFSDDFVIKMFNKNNNPDICIGYDEKIKDETLIDLTIKHFKKYGYSISLNYPYSGSLIPNKYYNSNNNRIKSIMIYKKDLYLDSNTKINHEKNEILKKCMNDYYENVIKVIN